MSKLSLEAMQLADDAENLIAWLRMGPAENVQPWCDCQKGK